MITSIPTAARSPFTKKGFSSVARERKTTLVLAQQKACAKAKMMPNTHSLSSSDISTQEKEYPTRGLKSQKRSRAPDVEKELS
jgi:hypothetical protein